MTTKQSCYWTDIARQAGPAGESLNGTIDADVAIVGGGIVGIVTARLLKDRGHKVAVIEAGRAGFGVTGRSTAKVTAQHATYLQRIDKEHGEDAARIYAEANRAGVDLIAELNARHQLNCDFEPADSWVYATGDEGAAELEKEKSIADSAGLAMELAHAIDLPFPVKAALRLASQWQFQPVDFVAQLAATIPGDGSLLFDHSPATGWSESHVETAGGTVRARHVVMATHLPLGREGDFGAQLRPHMHAVMAMPVEAERAPSGMYISVDQPKRSLRAHRQPNGEIVLILTGPVYRHGDAEAERKGFAELKSFAAEQFGAVEDSGWLWTNEDYTPRDHLPYVGWCGAEGKSVLVASGFDAWGLSNGAAAAQILADLCEGRDNPWASTFDASRHSLNGAGELIGNAAGFVRDVVKSHVPSPDPRSATSDEGDVVDVKGRAAGLYRRDGDLKAVSAVCTHMGCLVGWNPVDRTWDCPCHGSRFAEDGKVIHGPAVEPLEAVPLDELETEGAGS